MRNRLPAFVRLLELLGVEDPQPWLEAVERVRASPEPVAEETPALPDDRAAEPAEPGPDRGLGLPADTAHLIGRDDAIDEIVRALTRPGVAPGTSSVVVVHGMAGVGKTTVASRAARLLVDRFPDGCLFLELRGQGPVARAVAPADALDRLLRLSGVSGARIPGPPDDRAALLREHLTGRRYLVVLDDARDAAQVLPLLPAEPGCGVIVTSRNRLVALDEARAVALGPLAPADAAALFRAIVDPYLESGASPHVERIVAFCGYLPLAIRIAAAKFRADPTSPAELADRLSDERERLAELDDGQRSVAASIRASLVDLPADDRDLFVVLARTGGPDIDTFAATALAGGPRRRAVMRRLDRLIDRSLVERRSRGRYRLHDLVRAVARADSIQGLTSAEEARAQLRLVDFYLATADRADRTITPHRHRVPLNLTHQPAEAPDLDRYEDALAWLLDEEDNLVAACEQAASAGLEAPCWQLAFTLRGYFFITKRWAAWEATHHQALAATRRLGDRRAEAMILNNLGLVAIEQRRFDAASADYRQALELFREVGDSHGEHTSLANLAWLRFYRGDHEGFVLDATVAHDFYRREGAERNAAITLRGIALAELELGRVEVAVEHLASALAVFERLGLRLDAAMALNSLGEAHSRRLRAADAVEHHRRALAEALCCGSLFEQARAHFRLGDLAAAAAEPAAAREHWQQALRAYRDLGAPEAVHVADRLAVAEPA